MKTIAKGSLAKVCTVSALCLGLTIAASASYLNVDANVDFGAEYFIVTQQDNLGNLTDTIYTLPAVQHGLQHFQFDPISDFKETFLGLTSQGDVVVSFNLQGGKNAEGQSFGHEFGNFDENNLIGLLRTGNQAGLIGFCDGSVRAADMLTGFADGSVMKFSNGVNVGSASVTMFPAPEPVTLIGLAVGIVPFVRRRRK